MHKHVFTVYPCFAILETTSLMDINSSQYKKRSIPRSLDGMSSVRRDHTTYTRRRPVAAAHKEYAQTRHQHHQSPSVSVPQAKTSEYRQAESSESLLRFDLPAYHPHEHPVHIVRSRRNPKRTFARMSAGLAVCLIMVGSFSFWRAYMQMHKVFRGSTTVAALSAEKVAPELLKGEGDGRVNVLLLGVGGENHPGGDLTDTMVVLSVDPVNNTSAMLSVPRDLWVKMPVNYFGAYQKINAAYSSGKYKYLGKTDLSSTDDQAIEAGFASVDQAVSDVLGITINYHVLVNFQAFEQAINTVNGVTINVKNQLYDPTMAWENGNNPVLAAVGVQDMTGKQALNYARSRETSSDFARSERQRELLVALKQKVLTLGTLSSPTKIDNLMKAFSSNVHTDLSTKAASRLFSIMKKISDDNVASLSLTEPVSLVTTDRVGNASVVRPKAGFNTYSDIQTYVRSQLKDGYLVKENAGVYVVGANEALQSRVMTTLQTYGYHVVGSTVAAPSAKLPSGITIVDVAGKSPYTRHYLQDRYGVAATDVLPANLQVPNGTQFVIIAGT